MGKCPAPHVSVHPWLSCCTPCTRAGLPGAQRQARKPRRHGGAWEHPSLRGRVKWHAVRSNPVLLPWQAGWIWVCPEHGRGGWGCAPVGPAVPCSAWRSCGHRGGSWRFPLAFASHGPAASASSGLISVLWLPVELAERSLQIPSRTLPLRVWGWCVVS